MGVPDLEMKCFINPKLLKTTGLEEQLILKAHLLLTIATARKRCSISRNFKKSFGKEEQVKLGLAVADFP